jgi:ATP-dependent Clp protease ATP-binding subunit ClpX
MSETNNENLTCNFCGKSRDQVEKLIAGPNVYICDECVTISYDIIDKNPDDINIHGLSYEDIPKPEEIKAYLDEYVIGQESAKELLSVHSYNHYKRISKLIKDTVIEKSNILLMGSTGTGKTLLARTLANKLKVPFAIADATTLTESGYVGEDVESVLERLLTLSDFDVELAQRGIVFIDEIDKKARRSESNTSTRDVSGEGVQQALLRLIEGTTTKIKIQNSKKFGDDYTEFDTSNVLFILSGAFVGIEDIIEKRIKRKSNIGFNSNIVGKDQRNKLLDDIINVDVVDYGLIPELVGRLPVIATLEQLDKKQLRTLLTNIKNSIINQVNALLELDDIELQFGEEYLDFVAEKCHKSKIGARSIKSMIDNSVTNLMYRVEEFNKKGVKVIRLDKYPYKYEYNPVLITDAGEEIDTEFKLYRGINDF